MSRPRNRGPLCREPARSSVPGVHGGLISASLPPEDAWGFHGARAANLVGPVDTTCSTGTGRRSPEKFDTITPGNVGYYGYREQIAFDTSEN